MADVSNVQTSDLREILDSLEALSCEYQRCIQNYVVTDER